MFHSLSLDLYIVEVVTFGFTNASSVLVSFISIWCFLLSLF